MTNQKKYKPLSNSELAAFSDQMAMILHSGIPAIEGITVMSEDADSEEEKALLLEMKDTLYQTGSFSQSLRDAGIFPAYFLKMVEIGEHSGRLDEVMESLAFYYEREDNLSKAIRSAITYPLIMVCMMLLIILLLITKVLPIFQQVFEQLGGSLGGFSKGLLQIGAGISRYSFVFAGILCILALAVLFFTKTKQGRNAVSAFTSRLKMTRAFSDQISACRFAQGMALTLSSGLTVEQSLELSGGLTNNPAFQERLADCRELMKQGETFSEALIHTGIFSGLYARMLAMGFRTGSTDEVLHKIASSCEEEIDTKLRNIIAIIEPTLVAVLSVIVGMILLSVMLPLMGILSGM